MTLCRVNHACVPNARMEHDEDQGSLYATCDIEPGEEIIVNYGAIGTDAHFALEWVQQEWEFDCKCGRCDEYPEAGDVKELPTRGQAWGPPDPKPPTDPQPCTYILGSLFTPIGMSH
jgi:hypothetical protein